ncbi:hypothetical protein AGDE_11617 [Angomonas deanei]|uniref:Uncharacterized protein n=1 Tax=Angomonas deanei TaxID=59799 RepID=A0A7G2C488_9TRYP|nr:hypothetical protein AGDE_11617 [Angomonas deanei]CAD2214419.1 hypothetical protein, conserved [Angomonas deanei]|eukprot:EPY25948.1 hypothetical protein AGDE_11617 [Angomonas deanei]
MLESSFYSSIFTGHHVAINAIGTSHMLSTAQVTLVDYEISLAFAKLMRLFNCMAHAETSEDEERILVESTSKELNSTLWGEIYTACYGKRSSEAYDVSQEGITSDRYGGTVATPPADQRGILSRGSQATLLNFTQVSVRSASPKSMVPYLRTHGRRDRDLLCMFNRLPHDSARGEEDSTERHASFTEESILIGSSRPSPVKKGRLATLRDYLALLWSGRVTAADTEEEETASLTEEEANRRALEAVARQRAELLLRRDVVKVFENADVTIWQPGVLERPNPRLTERFFSLFSRPVHVGALAECITDDIIETIAEKPREIVLSTPKGTVKVIKGFSVSRRVQMKLLEDGLNVKDSQPKASFWRRRQYF